MPLFHSTEYFVRFAHNMFHYHEQDSMKHIIPKCESVVATLLMKVSKYLFVLVYERQKLLSFLGLNQHYDVFKHK